MVLIWEGFYYLSVIDNATTEQDVIPGVEIQNVTMLRPFSTQTTLKQAQTTRPQWSHPQHRAQAGLRVAFQLLLTEGTDGRLECTGAVTSPVAYLSIIFGDRSYKDD